ncbi:hypothetical protein Bca4012_085198 [Brassica carinata]
MQNPRLKQQQALMQQQVLMQQHSLYHPGVLAPPQLEPLPSGNLPPGFDPSTCRSVYVGNIHTQVTEPLLHEIFTSTGPVESSKLIRKDKSSYGFVHYFDRRSAALAILSLNGRHLQIRCNWATKGAISGEDKHSSDGKSVVELTTGSSEDGKETSNEDAPENNSQFTTVYVGNLAPEVTQLDLHRFFHALGAGVIEEVRVQRDKGFGFVRYNTHPEAALAIQMGNSQPYLFNRQIKCSWGSKPTPPGTASNPLPPPAPAPVPGLTAADLLAYERQLALSKMALMHPQGQHPLRQAAHGINAAGANAAMYDGGFQNVASAQQLMYYQ